LYVESQGAALATAIKDVSVTVANQNDPYVDYINNLTPEKAKAFLSQVMGPPRRVLEDSEREHMLTIFKLLEPVETSNNQWSFTEEYSHANKVYHVHYFDDETIVEEFLDDL
jgi:hypothetical protein